jgi:hypothetical protein
MPATEAEQQSLGLSLMRAMIAAAKSDGHIDAKEQSNIFAQLDNLNLSAEEKAFVLDELRKPLDVDAVARGACTPEQAAEIYVASLLALDVDNAAERRYLASLAIKLRLDEKLVEHLHATVEGAARAGVRRLGAFSVSSAASTGRRDRLRKPARVASAAGCSHAQRGRCTSPRTPSSGWRRDRAA